MSVISKDFSILNPLRPANASFGEVVGISLYDRFTDCRQRSYVGFSKRKSIHVPPSSNAYWNYMALQSLLTTWCSERGISRQDRTRLYHDLACSVRHIHLIELEGAYGHSSFVCQQYWDLEICGFLTPVISHRPSTNG